MQNNWILERAQKEICERCQRCPYEKYQDCITDKYHLCECPFEEKREEIEGFCKELFEMITELSEETRNYEDPEGDMNDEGIFSIYSDDPDDKDRYEKAI